MEIDDLRKRIDAIDEKLLDLLNERARCSVDVGKLKRDGGHAAVYVPEREKRIYDSLRERNPGPLPGEAIRAIYREVLSASVALQNPLSVAFLGPEFTFSHMAALRVFGSMPEYHPLQSISDVFTEVERGRVAYGVVPVETAMGGGVSDTLDRFGASSLKIVNEIMLHISQNLLANCPLSEVTKVYSKAQPFVQCRQWLRANLPHALLIETSSTARAAETAASEPGAAAIASSLAAEAYGLGTLVSGIEDAAHNYTRFFVIGQHGAKPTGHDKTAIMASIKDRAGALFDMLSPFSKHDINMTRIESRPSQKRAWDYVFFIDFEGHAEDPAAAKALEEVAEHCKELRILGSFPYGEIETDMAASSAAFAEGAGS